MHCCSYWIWQWRIVKHSRIHFYSIHRLGFSRLSTANFCYNSRSSLLLAMLSGKVLNVVCTHSLYVKCSCRLLACRHVLMCCECQLHYYISLISSCTLSLHWLLTRRLEKFERSSLPVRAADNWVLYTMTADKYCTDVHIGTASVKQLCC